MKSGEVYGGMAGPYGPRPIIAHFFLRIEISADRNFGLVSLRQLFVRSTGRRQTEAVTLSVRYVDRNLNVNRSLGQLYRYVNRLVRSKIYLHNTRFRFTRMHRQMQEFPPQTRTVKIFDLRDLGKHTTFPISIRDETFETIPHPAASLIHPDSQLKNPLPPLSVPAFWDPKEFKDTNGHDGIRSYLGNYGARLMTPEEAMTIGSFYHDNESSTISLPTIFMAFASYRDFQCPETIRSLFLCAKFPQRVRVAVVDQYDYQ